MGLIVFVYLNKNIYRNVSLKYQSKDEIVFKNTFSINGAETRAYAGTVFFQEYVMTINWSRIFFFIFFLNPAAVEVCSSFLDPMPFFSRFTTSKWSRLYVYTKKALLKDSDEIRALNGDPSFMHAFPRVFLD